MDYGTFDNDFSNISPMSSEKRKELTFYPWSMSATGDWGDDSGLTELAKYAKGEIPPTELAEWLWEPGAYVQNSAVAELLKHGNVKQAAIFVKTLVSIHPVCEKTLKEQFGGLVDEFIKNPDKYPSSPAEYPADVVVRLIQ